MITLIQQVAMLLNNRRKVPKNPLKLLTSPNDLLLFTCLHPTLVDVLVQNLTRAVLLTPRIGEFPCEHLFSTLQRALIRLLLLRRTSCNTTSTTDIPLFSYSRGPMHSEGSQESKGPICVPCNLVTRKKKIIVSMYSLFVQRHS